MKNTVLILSVILFLTACFDSSSVVEEKRAKLKDKAQSINSDLNNISKEVKKLAELIEDIYIQDEDKDVDRSRYILLKNGIFYKENLKDESAVFVSGYVKVDDNLKNIVYKTEQLDSVFKEITQKYKEAVQIYYNDKNSYNRIYPPFDVLTQYEPKMNIPSFNFYYLADEVNDPEKKAVWVTEPYVDPAGRGWMISAIAPVYYKGKVEGVPGIDVTIDTITERYIGHDNEDYMILSLEGLIVSTSEKFANVLSFPLLTDHKYIETIKSDKYLIDDYNILKSKYKKIRKLGKKIILSNEKKIEFEKDKKKYLILREDIQELGWKIIILIEK